MFVMPQELPLYIHCLANICGPDEDCVKVWFISEVFCNCGARFTSLVANI